MVLDAEAERVLAEASWDEAFQAQRIGDEEVAAVMRDLSRRHRVGALELEARIAAWRPPYGTMPGNG